MRNAITALLFLASTSSTNAETGMAQVFGIGQFSCATWLQNAAYEDQGVVWIWGFFSGANARNPQNHAVGKSTDGNGITALIKAECQKDPSQILTTAASVVYNNLATEGR